MQTSIINEELPSTIPYIVYTKIYKEITITTISNEINEKIT